MRSIKLQAGDEILTTNHEYGAMDRTWNFFCKKSGAKYVRQEISLPIVSKEQIIEEFWKGYNSNTKIIFLNQISSSTALLFPVKEICDKARQLGLITIIDGAHVPGHIDLNITDLNPDFYTGTLHKWMFAPKGSSFLYVKKEYQNKVDPLVVSWGYNAMFPSSSQFQDYHQMNGTRDYSAFLTIPAAIQFMNEHNWKQVATSCRKLVQANAAALCELLSATAIAPITDDFIVQLFSAEIKTTEPEKLHNHFFEQYKIQIPVMRHDDKVYLRYSINAFNSQQDLDKLFAAIKEIKKDTNLIK